MIFDTLNRAGESVILNKNHIDLQANNIKKSQLLFYKEVPFIDLATLIKKVNSVWIDMLKYIDFKYLQE